jgi:hypothetical protein
LRCFYGIETLTAVTIITEVFDFGRFSDYNILSCYFNVGDYIDRGRYYYLDNGLCSERYFPTASDSFFASGSRARARQMPCYRYHGIQSSRISSGPGSPVVHVGMGPSLEPVAEARAISCRLEKNYDGSSLDCKVLRVNALRKAAAYAFFFN